MEVQKLDICLRDYRKDVTGWKGVFNPQEIPMDQNYQAEYQWKVPFYKEMELSDINLDDIIKYCREVDIKSRLEE